MFTVTTHHSKSCAVKSAKGEAHGAKSAGDQAQDYKSPLPVKFKRMCLISPAVMCDSTGKVLPTREARYT